MFGTDAVRTLHGEVIRIKGVSGIRAEGMLESCLERPFVDVYGHRPFPTFFLKAAALLHSIIVFHPFIDGNKRTALLATDLFLSLNGYTFKFPKDAVEFTLAIAKLEIEDMATIAGWIERACTRNELYGMNEEVVLSMAKTIRISLASGTTIPLQLEKK